MKQENFLIVPRGVTVSETGLVITSQLSFNEYELLAEKVQRCHRSVLWIIGDLLHWGANRFGETYSQVIEPYGHGYSMQSLLNAQWVASRVAPHSRRRELSWSHHLEIASLERPDQDRLLEEAINNDWGVRELRTAVRAHKGKKVADAQAETNKQEEKVMGFNFQEWETPTLIKFAVHSKACWDSLAVPDDKDTSYDPVADHDFLGLFNAIAGELQRRGEWDWVQWVVNEPDGNELDARLIHVDHAFPTQSTWRRCDHEQE